MLHLHPNCEACDKDLPPDASDACICTYECTFFRDCVDKLLANVCPNCGGGFEPRPIRPRTARRDGVSLAHHPASEARIHARYTEAEIRYFSTQHQHVDPRNR